MDLMTLIIFVVSFVVCGGIVFGVSVFGAKEQTFEEALEEKRRKLKAESGIQGGEKSRKSKESQKSSKWASKRKAAGGGGERTETSDKTHGNKDDVIEDAVEPELETIQPVEEVEEEESPQTTPEPVSNKSSNKKNKKKAMVIEEVEETTPPVVISNTVEQQPIEEPIVEEVAVQKKAKSSSSSATANNNNNKKKETKNNLNAKEILTIVKKTPMDDSECQHLIDVLLNKRVGHPNTSIGEWIENPAGGSSNSNSQSGSSKGGLQKQLADKEKELVEANASVKSISDRVAILRQELNTSKSLIANSNKVMEEMKMKHQRDLNNQQATLKKQMENQTRHQNGLQMHIQELERTIQTLRSAAPQQPDPAVYEMQMQMTEMSNTLNREIAEKEELRNQLQISQNQINDMDKKNLNVLNEMSSSKKALEDKCKFLESSKNNNGILQEKIDELMRAKGDSDKKLNELSKTVEHSSKKIREKEEEVSRLSEENERLSEQLASAVERPKAEGQEAGKTNGDLNGHSSSPEVKEAMDGWRNKYLSLVSENESIAKNNEVIVNDLKVQLEKSKHKVSELETEVEGQRSKNNDASVAAANASTKLKADLENNHKVFLQRLFPDISINEKEHSKWLDSFEDAVQQSRQQSDDNASNSALEKQVAHYQSVLSETETMLKQLQMSVEAEEVQWKQKLHEKELELVNVKGERDLLAKKNSAMDESLHVVKQAEEMQIKLHELQEKLSSEEAEKEELVKKFAGVDDQLKEKDRLSNEVNSLKSSLEEERKSNTKLAERLAKMGHLVSTGTEALQQEQKTIELLTDQVKNTKTTKGNDVGDSTTKGDNGSLGDIESTKSTKEDSQLGSMASLDLSETSSNNTTTNTPNNTASSQGASKSATSSNATAPKQKKSKKKKKPVF